MSKSGLKFQILKYTILGIVIGFLFPAIAFFIGYFSNKSQFKAYWDYILTGNWTVILLLLTPIVFVLFIYFISRKFLLYIHKLQTSLDTNEQNSTRLLEFSEKLKDSEIDAEYELLDENDKLGKSLINLRDSFKNNKIDEENRRKEDHQRHWATEGIAKFSEILRQHNDNLNVMSYQILSTFVNYLGAIQGGFFILNDNDKDNIYFEQKASYAYSRKKFTEKRINWGEGLIGACGLEKETIFITDVTENYVNVTSGLGESNPRCILIVPLKVNDEIFGAIEVASFKILEKYKIDFAEKLAESISSTIASFKINNRTARLLKASQGQAKKMAQQEELLRQNLEELQITQEEAAKQSEEFVSFTNSVNHTLIRAEYKTNGTLIYANTKFLKKLGYSSNLEVEGQEISMFINEKDREWFTKIWIDLAKGGPHFEDYMKHVTKGGTDLWTMATYTCVRNSYGDVEKILFLAIDTTEQKKMSLDYEGQIKALDTSSIKAEFTPAGKVIECNLKFLNTLEYTSEEVKTKNVFEFIPQKVQKLFKVTWSNVINEIPFEGQIKNLTSKGNEKWFQATYIAVNDMYGEIAKIIMIAYDVTVQKEMEIKTQNQKEQLKQQEEKLQLSEIQLSRKLEETREEMKRQFKKIEVVKMLNEKSLEGLLDAVVTINKISQIDFFNKAAEELWGLKRQDILGCDISLLLPKEYDTEEQFMGNYFKPGNDIEQGNRIEVFIINKAKERISVLLTLSEARIGNEYTLTAFIQNIEVELF